VYGWYFSELPWPIDTSQCVTWDGGTLLYGGIAPKAPPANGRPASQQSLRHRIRYHYTGNAAGSTLRLTLGCLLAERLGIQLHRAEPVPPAGHPPADQLRVGCRAAREAGANMGRQAWAGALARFDGRSV